MQLARLLFTELTLWPIHPPLPCCPWLPPPLSWRLQRSRLQRGTRLTKKATSTRRIYRTDFESFRASCAEHNASPLPAHPGTIAAFRGFEAPRLRPWTINRRLAAIRYAHRLAGLPTPTADERVRAIMRGIRRTLETVPAKKAPATADKIRAMLPPVGEQLSWLRDRAAPARLCRGVAEVRTGRSRPRRH